MGNVNDNLRSVVGVDSVLLDADELRVYECDGLPQHKSLPAGVAILKTTEQVARVVSALAEAGRPFVARGAGTGLSGGALALDGAYVLALARLNRILATDPSNRTIRVETGVLNSDVSRSVRPLGLYYSPDPSSQSACTIGGNIAENAGGIHCLRHGVTTDHVAALTVVLSDGEIVELHDTSVRPGYDLAGVFVGSEGTFGIATEATLRLLPIPASVKTILAAFRTIREGSSAVSEIIASGILPAALEMMDTVAIHAVEASVYKAGLPLDAGAALIIEVEGVEAEVSAEAAILERICIAHGAVSVRGANDAADRDRIWKARKGAFGAMGRLSPDIMIQDAVVPRSRLPEVLEQIHVIASRYGLTVANVFHAGDGNLHPLIPFDSSDPGAVERVKDAGREMMQVCIRTGGAITGEHGVGVDKIDYLGLTYSAEDLETMLKVRAAFDPLGLCNPGKAIPVVRGCGEARAVATKAAPEPSEPPHIAIGRQAPILHYSRSRPAHSSFDPERGLTKFAGIVGPEHVRESATSLLVEPASREEVSECLRQAASNNWTVMPMGPGNWPDAGETATPANVLLSTTRLCCLVAHEPADLVATVEGGMRLDQLNAALGTQWVPLDPPFHATSTVGGIVATGIAGPLSSTFGRPRNLVLGLKAALADGTIVKAGGSVVKNVAGYDLSKLFTGSFGTLAVVLEVNLRLRAMPDADRTLLIFGTEPMSLVEEARRLRSAGVFPSAAGVISSGLIFEATAPSPYVMLLRFMGLDAAVAAQTSKVRALQPVESERDGPEHWQRLSSVGDEIICRVSTRPSELAAVATVIRESLKGATLHLDPFQGWIRCFASGEAENGIALSKIRALAHTAGGSMVIDRSPDALKDSLGAWGDLGSAGKLMTRIKSQLDPENRLSPGRFNLG